MTRLRVPLSEGVADPELAEKARRRRFSAKYKLAIVREADGCERPGEIGALLRREGLYSSHLGKWRAAGCGCARRVGGEAARAASAERGRCGGRESAA